MPEYCTDNPSPKKYDLHITFYNNKHEHVKDIPIVEERENGEHFIVLSANERSNTICLTLESGNTETNATFHALGNSTMGTIHRYLLAVFISKNRGNTKVSKLIDLSTSTLPANAEYTYNPFANTHNILMLSFKLFSYQFGLDWLPEVDISNLFLKFEEDDLKLSTKWIKNSMANDYLHKNTDTTASFTGVPLFEFTNDNGLSTLIQESYTLEKGSDFKSKPYMNTYLGNLAITQYDDDGKELWGIVLPKNHCFKSYKGPYNYTLMSQKHQSQVIYGDLPTQVYDRQFYAINTYGKNRNFYMLFNDYNSNFNNTIKNPGDTVYSYESTNACYYKMDRKKEISKKHLFGEPAAGEFISCFTEGADFIEKTGMYAALVRSKKGETITLRMAWAWLD